MNASVTINTAAHRRHAFVLVAALVLATARVDAATVVINNNDGAGEGFNDATPFTPVGGNPATTVGQARLNAFQFAADIWGSCLESAVPIQIDAQFNALTCTPTSAVLGSAGTNSVHRNFGAAAPYPPELAGTWYPQALANAMDGTDLNAQADATAQFNSSINGSAGCLGGRNWYYGFDGSPPGSDIDFVTVLLHELGHSLGFQTFMNLGTGALFNGGNDTYLLNMERHGASPSAYSAMTDAQRSAANTADPDIHFIGPQVTALAGSYTAGVSAGHVRLNAPSPVVPGSSISHFTTALVPNEAMEPSYTGPTHEIGLAFRLMQDIGWRLLPSDLWGRDTAADAGVEPHAAGPAMWESPDIWVRENQDTVSGVRSTGPVYANEHVHENAEYKTTGPNYVYVKVRNRACRNNAGDTGVLKVYFAKAGTGLTWPDDWVGSVVGSVVHGDLIATLTIPPIEGGAEWVAEVPWTVPNPADFAAFAPDENHFCLLARVETSVTAPFGMTTPEGANVNDNTRNNNNIWWKNISIYDMNPSNLVFESRILVGGSKQAAGKYDLNFRVPAAQAKDGLLHHGELRIDLGELHDAWKAAGGGGTGFRSLGDKNVIAVADPVEGAWLRGIPFGDGEPKLVGLLFELKQRPKEKRTFNFTATQVSEGAAQPDGGVTLEVRWNPAGGGGEPAEPPRPTWLERYWWILLLVLLALVLVLLAVRRK